MNEYIDDLAISMDPAEIDDFDYIALGWVLSYASSQQSPELIDKLDAILGFGKSPTRLGSRHTHISFILTFSGI
jgi:hypothetical protein